jgi:hypothetical protein
VGDIATDEATDKGTGSKEDGVDSLQIVSLCQLYADGRLTYHGTTSLVHEEDLSNDIRSKGVGSATSNAIECKQRFNHISSDIDLPLEESSDE